MLAKLLGEEQPDTVIHLAAQTLVGPALADPVETFSHNAAGTWTLLEACRRQGGPARIVVASSDKAYGDAGGRPYRETMALRPTHPYDASKAMTDLLARTYAHSYGLPIGITRCANLYGGGDLNWSRIVPGTIRSVLRDERPEIRSDGTFLRDYLFVGDAARAVLILAEAVGRRPELHGAAFNFAAGQRLTALEMVDANPGRDGLPAPPGNPGQRPQRGARPAGVGRAGPARAWLAAPGLARRRPGRDRRLVPGLPRPDRRVTTACGSCGSRLEPVLWLGNQPLANALLTAETVDRPEATFPLTLAVCSVCGLVQITEAVPPEVLFREYAYFSSVSAAFVEHARLIAERMAEAADLTDRSLVDRDREQ